MNLAWCPAGHGAPDRRFTRSSPVRSKPASRRSTNLPRARPQPEPSADDAQNLIAAPRSRSRQRSCSRRSPQAAVQLDALPVDELRRRVRTAIEGLIDVELWNRQVMVQEV